MDNDVIHYDGYRGIWFDLIRGGIHKYSGGLGTYTAKHIPLAIYAPEVDKTFFVWGGTSHEDERKLRLMISYYDHQTGTVPYPVMAFSKEDVNDPHDNPALSIDSEGHIWFVVAGRGGNRRPGYFYRSKQPYNIDDFEFVHEEQEFAYPQPWYVPGKGFLACFTKYRDGRELYWMTSSDGYTWSEHGKLAGFGGHYQISWQKDGRIITAFNRHINGNVNTRTDLYFLQTSDFGNTWQSASGDTIALPLDSKQNPALVYDYHSEGLLVYMKDINFDGNGNPVILYITSPSWDPGETEPSRSWMLAHWTGNKWNFSRITDAYHNYDMGSLYIEQNQWRIIAPTEPGPQLWGTGGEVAMWISDDQGTTWRKEKDLTNGSLRNHSYVRRPLNAHPGFYGFWADGNPHEFSVSRLYFTTQNGSVFELPPTMNSGIAKPKLVYGTTTNTPYLHPNQQEVDRSVAERKDKKTVGVYDIQGRKITLKKTPTNTIKKMDMDGKVPMIRINWRNDSE